MSDFSLETRVRKKNMETEVRLGKNFGRREKMYHHTVILALKSDFSGAAF